MYNDIPQTLIKVINNKLDEIDKIINNIIIINKNNKNNNYRRTIIKELEEKILINDINILLNELKINIKKEINIDDTYIENIINRYENKIKNKITKFNDDQNIKQNINIFNNLNKKDSLFFLSENNNIYTKFKIKKKWFSNNLDFDDCIKYLQVTERIYIIKNNIYDEFMNKYTIYYDDEEHKNNPKFDILYRRITDNYYVSNNNYFEKIKEFYFKLYSNIFTSFNVKEIRFDIFKNSIENKSNSIGANIEAVNVNAKKNTTMQNKNEKGTKMEFDKKYGHSDLRDICQEVNGCNDDNNTIIDFFKKPQHTYNKMDIYCPLMIINLIKNRTENRMTKFQEIQSVENIDTNSVELSIKLKYNLHFELGLFSCSKKSNYINERVVFEIIFYPYENINTNELKLQINEIPTIYTNSSTTPSTITPSATTLSATTPSATTPSATTPSATTPITSTISVNEQHSKTKVEPLWIEWVNIARGDTIPKYAIKGGITATDGVIYVGKIKNSPGKVNLDNNKIWNYWVQGEGSSTYGKMLITNIDYKWQLISKGESIPKKAIYCGRDKSNDCVWIGKSVKTNELGKINCENNNKIESNYVPTMNNLWCHSSWSSSQTALILVLTDIKQDMYKTEILNKIFFKKEKLEEDFLDNQYLEDE